MEIKNHHDRDQTRRVMLTYLQWRLRSFEGNPQTTHQEEANTSSRHLLPKHPNAQKQNTLNHPHLQKNELKSCARCRKNNKKHPPRNTTSSYSYQPISGGTWETHLGKSKIRQSTVAVFAWCKNFGIESTWHGAAGWCVCSPLGPAARCPFSESGWWLVIVFLRRILSDQATTRRDDERIVQKGEEMPITSARVGTVYWQPCWVLACVPTGAQVEISVVRTRWRWW